MPQKHSLQKGSKPKPKATFHWEFGGVYGTMMMMIFLPITTYGRAASGRLLLPVNFQDTLDHPFQSIVHFSINPLIAFIANLCSIDLPSILIYTLWLIIQLAFDRLLPGKTVLGVPCAELKGAEKTPLLFFSQLCKS